MAFVGDLRIDCTALDISAVGIGMRGPRLATPGQFLRLNFCLQTDSGVPRWFDADGVVARVVLRGDAYEFGVQFLVVEDRVAKEIHGYVTGAQRAALLQAQATEWPSDGLPDATHPPKRTGEFGPAGSNSDKRRTAEYGSSVQAAAVGETPGSSSSSSGNGTGETRRGGTGETQPGTGETKRGTGDTKRSTNEQRRAGTNPPFTGSTTARTNPPDASRAARPAPREAPLAPLEDLVPQSELKALYRAALSEVSGAKDSKKKK